MRRFLTILFLLWLTPTLVIGQKLPPPERRMSVPPEAQTYLFHFVPGRDAFYVPWKGNGQMLDTLLTVVQTRLPQLRAGEIYIHVAGYAPTGSASCNPVRTGYLRNCRVKSELITQIGATEAMFLTDKYHPEAYEGLRNVVVVTFPVHLLPTLREPAVEQPQPTVEPLQPTENKESANEPQTPETEPSCSEPTNPVPTIAMEPENTEPEPAPVSVPAPSEESPTAPAAKSPVIALHANLLRWAMLTPDLGIEWRISRHVGILVNGSYTSWTWKGLERRHALWEVSPEIRWYLGARKRGYVGAMFQAGSFNFKYATTGRQGDHLGGGIVGGYQFPIGRRLALDLSAGAGCTHADYDKYRIIDGLRVRQGSGSKNYWGVNHLTVGLVWTFGGNE